MHQRHECGGVVERGETYEIRICPGAVGGRSICCLDCRMLSHHPEDVRQRFCACCHQWHDIKALQRRLEREEARREARHKESSHV